MQESESYETWTARLWLESREEYYSHYMQIYQDLEREHGRDDAILKLAGIIRGDFFAHSPLPQHGGVYEDLLSLAISQIDYVEIAARLTDQGGTTQ